MMSILISLLPEENVRYRTQKWIFRFLRFLCFQMYQYLIYCFFSFLFLTQQYVESRGRLIASLHPASQSYELGLVSLCPPDSQHRLCDRLSEAPESHQINRSN